MENKLVVLLIIIFSFLAIIPFIPLFSFPKTVFILVSGDPLPEMLAIQKLEVGFENISIVSIVNPFQGDAISTVKYTGEIFIHIENTTLNANIPNISINQHLTSTEYALSLIRGLNNTWIIVAQQFQ